MIFANYIAIFKTSRFFEYGQFLMAEGLDWGIFCTLLSSTQGFKKWTLMSYGFYDLFFFKYDEILSLNNNLFQENND